MTIRLGTRLTWFFLASLAIVLVGFSIALHAMADYYVHRQAIERLESALNTIAAAAEIGPDGVEWEPEERSLRFGRRTLEGQFVWRVGDERGGRIDGSASGELDRVLARLGEEDRPSRHPRLVLDAAGSTWRIMSRRLGRASSADAGARVPRPATGRHPALILGVAASTEATRATLRNLGLTLAGLSVTVWTVALAAGRWLCRVALRPLTAMADAANAIGGDDPGRRLPTPATGDELEELGRSFNALLDRLGESLERQQRFTGDASHQLRTPLTALQGQVEVALRQDRPLEEYRRVLTLVRSKTRHLRQIVDGLMFLSRADAEARRPELERIALDDWLRAYLDAWPNPRRGDLVLLADRASVVEVLAHPPLLGELLHNLLDNAAKYGPAGTPITVRLGRETDAVVVSVNDEGPGIDPIDHPHIFSPFYRAEAARLRGTVGTGLGLSIADRIAVVLGGQVTAGSAPGPGATFILRLPIVDSVGPTAALERPERSLDDENTHEPVDP